ncbi:MAG: SDR family oxidoreductase [Pirellulaceae bacterium]|nr:SDR family oxidoreductase [Pirellulaceae bacterium]
MGTIAVLGATGTIGSSLASRLIASGQRVLLLGRNGEKLMELQQRLGHQAQVCTLQDFSSSDQLKAAIDGAVQDDPLTGMVNCIGSLILKPAHGTSDQEFRETIETNLFTAFATVRVAGSLLRKSGGSVVLLSSAAADIGLQNHEAISAAKAGIIGLARSAAATYASNNIRFNVVSPGLTRTEMTKRIWDNPTNCAASTDMHALGRLGSPEHIASAIAWLLDPANDWTTGEVIHVDGGLSQVIPRKKM